MSRGLDFRRRRRKKINFSAIRRAAVWIGEAVLAFAIGCVLVWYFGYSLQNVGQSMEPTIYSGDTVLVNRFIYSIKDPDYGDLIVFRPNGNENSPYYIKRVVGLPGDTVTIENGRVYVNGELLDEDIITESMEDAGLAEEGVTLGDGEYFVLGDNRNNSEDSRSADVGNVSIDDILGQAWFILSPRSRFGFLE